MKKAFSEYYLPAEEEFKEIWEQGLIVFDADVLLNLYRYSEKTVEKIIGIMKQMADKLWIPHQVALEYHKNRPIVISEQKRVYADLIKEYKKQEEIILESIEEIIKRYNPHPFINYESFETLTKAMYEEIIMRVENHEKRHPDYISADTILSAVTDIFNNKVGLPYGIDRLNKIYVEGKKRYEGLIPPGFEDLKEKKEPECYGDLIIWYQIIDKANEAKRPIIFVTDDSKEDWWWKVSGRTIGPRVELIKEIKFEIKVDKCFYMYNLGGFIRCAGKYLGVRIGEEVLKEVNEIFVTDESKIKEIEIIEKLGDLLENNEAIA